LKGIEPNGNKMVKGFKEDDVGVLINSLHNIGRAIRKIEKQLGIKETPLPMIDLEENFQ
jgi:hypothetical protein